MLTRPHMLANMLSYSKARVLVWLFPNVPVEIHTTIPFPKLSQNNNVL